MAINASEVAQLYAPNYNLGEIFNRSAQQAAQIKQQQDEQKRQADLDAFKYNKYLEDQAIGTGTPYDNLVNQRIQSAKNALVEAQKGSKTPLTFTQRAEITNPYLADLSQQQNIASNLQKQIGSYTQQIQKEFPYVDQTKLPAYLSAAAFRDAQGNVRTSLDQQALEQAVSQLNDPNVFRKFVNSDQLGQFLPEDYAKRFGVTDERIPVAGQPGVYAVAPLREGYQYNPKTQGVELMTEQIGDQKGLPAAQVQNIFGTKAGKLALLNTREQMGIDKLDIPDSKKDQIAAYQLMQSWGPRLGKQSVKMDFTEAKEKLAERAANRADAREERMANMQMLQFRHELSKEAQAKADKIDNTPMAYAVNIIRGDKNARAAAPTIPMYDPKLKTKIPVYDLNALLKTDNSTGGLLDDPNGSTDKFQMVFNPVNKSLGLIRMKKLPAANGGGFIPDLSKSEQISEADIPKTLSRFATQFKVSPKEFEQFYETLKENK